jgi:hypothetical protein
MLRIFAKMAYAMSMTLMESLRYSNAIRAGKIIPSLVYVITSGICVNLEFNVVSAL